MIPPHSHDGVLPPFIPGASPTTRGAVAPYRAEMLEVIDRFGSSPTRRDILEGLLAYREALRNIGILEGFQWIDGSFVENCELIRGRPPKDVDVITFAPRPVGLDESAWRALVHSNMELFDPAQVKEKFSCDAYFVDLGAHPVQLVSNTRYWFGLFSHQRDTFIWKGMIEVALDDDDIEAKKLLSAGGKE